MYTGACGQFTILCFILCLGFCIATIAQAGIYINSVNTDQHILCGPSAVDFWGLLLPVEWGPTLLLLILLVLNLRLNRREIGYVHSRVHSMTITLILLAPILWCVETWYVLPMSIHAGAIIQPYNTSFLYQYGSLYGRPQVFQIFLDIVDLNETASNSTCSPYMTRDLCSCGRDLLSRLNTSTVFRCIPNDDKGLHFILSYLEPFSNISHSAANLHTTFVVFFIFVFFMSMYRRFVPQEKWFDNYLCKLPNVGISERSPLLIGRLSRII